MGKLIDGDDGLKAEDVGGWVEDKHCLLRRYVDTSKGVRSKWLGPGKAGATFIDLFCGPGRAWDRDHKKFIDGGVVAAWKESVAGGFPFSQVLIADLDTERRELARTRLERLGAPVTVLEGSAVDAASQLRSILKPKSLHFAFLDPYNLRALDFGIIRTLSEYQYIDILIHLDQMDHQRNWAANSTAENSAFDVFAPGWRDVVDLEGGPLNVRTQVFQYWRDLVARFGAWPSTEMKLMTANKNQPLYWMLLAAKHDIAHRFWSSASNVEGQAKFDF